MKMKHCEEVFLYIYIFFQSYDQWGNVICHGNKADIKEGHKSFPSGHSSCKHITFHQLYFAKYFCTLH